MQYGPEKSLRDSLVLVSRENSGIIVVLVTRIPLLLKMRAGKGSDLADSGFIQIMQFGDPLDDALEASGCVGMELSPDNELQ